MKNIPLHRFKRKIKKMDTIKLMKKTSHIYSLHKIHTTDYLGAVTEELESRGIIIGE